MDNAHDCELVEKLTRGDQSAFEQLYDRHSASVFGLAFRVTNDRSLAEDVAQEAFLNLWRQASSFDPARAAVKTWLLTITHHRAVDAVRRRRRPTVELDESAQRAIDRQAQAPDVWHEVSARFDQAAVRAALATLSVPQRDALELAYFGGFTQAEIAARLNIPLGTVKSRVRLGLMRMSAALASATLPAVADDRADFMPPTPSLRTRAEKWSGRRDSNPRHSAWEAWRPRSEKYANPKRRPGGHPYATRAVVGRRASRLL